MKRLGTGMLTPALPFPASSKRCTVNYSGEISLSIGSGWFDFAGSRLLSVKGRTGKVWKCSRSSGPSSALSLGWGLEAAAAAAADGSWVLARENWCWNSSSTVSCALGLCYTPACSSFIPSSSSCLNWGAAGRRGCYVAQGERTPVVPIV